MTRYIFIVIQKAIIEKQDDLKIEVVFIIDNLNMIHVIYYGLCFHFKYF